MQRQPPPVSLMPAARVADHPADRVRDAPVDAAPLDEDGLLDTTGDFTALQSVGTVA